MKTLAKTGLLFAFAAALICSGCAKTGASGGPWDQETDIVIVGFGLAGAAAAVEAYDIDPAARILILEKLPETLKGGNTVASGQTILVPDAGDLENFKAYIRSCNQPNPVPEDYLDWWSREMAGQLGWIENTMGEAGYEVGYVGGGPLRWGAMVVEFAEFPGAGFQGCSASIRPAGEGYMSGGVFYGFEAAVLRRGIPVFYETPATGLVQDPETGRALGVTARDKTGRTLRIRAAKGVVLACGGFENNPEMQRNFHGQETTFTAGTPGNTGDGIRMLMKAGAKIWHMKNQTQSGGFWLGIKVPDYETAFMRNLYFSVGSWLEVDSDSRRFYNEAKYYHRQHMKEWEYGRYADLPHERALPVHLIFDEKTRRAGPIVVPYMAWPIVVEGYRWSEDNSAEVEKGWIIRADTIEELAQKTGRNPGVLRQTISRYNTLAARGADPDFGRDPARMAPLDTPPYYAVPLVPALVATTGGAVRNTRSQALDWDENPIPGLYTAGELGSAVSNLYQNGIFLAEAIMTGRAASQHILGVDPPAPAAPVSRTTLDWKTLPDGVYTGQGRSDSSSYTVTAALQGGRITKIEITQGQETMYSTPEQRAAFIDRVITAQNLDVEAVAGATQDCQGLVAALNQAFNRP